MSLSRLHCRDGQAAAEAKKRDLEIISFCQKKGKFWGDPAHLDEFVQGFRDSVEAA